MEVKKKILDLIIGLVILLILIQFGFLITRNRNIRNQTTQRFHSPLLLNSHAPAIRVVNLDKRKETISSRSMNEKILLFILSSSCVPCENNFPFWNRLSLQLKEKIRVIGIIIGELDEAKIIEQTKRVHFPLYIPEEKGVFISDYKVLNLSQTILIDEKNRVQWVKLGNLNADDYAEIKKLASDNSN